MPQRDEGARADCRMLASVRRARRMLKRRTKRSRERRTKHSREFAIDTMRMQEGSGCADQRTVENQRPLGDGRLESERALEEAAVEADGQRQIIRLLAALFAIHVAEHHVCQIRDEQRMR
jgi:hypothetical protein